MATQKQVPQDQLGQMLLMQLLGGGNQATTTTNAGNIDPAMQIFQQAATPMNPQMLQALMTTIQQNAAQNVPVLTQALANATGSRSSSNSPLALALNEQNNQANNQALVAIMENNLKQMQQGNIAASTIAQGTKGTKQTQEQGVKNPMQLLLGGMVLNNADKKGVFKKVGNKVDEWLGGDKNTASTGANPAGGFTYNPGLDFGNFGVTDYSLGGGMSYGGQGFQSSPLFDFSAAGFGDFGSVDYGLGSYSDIASTYAGLDPSSWNFAADYSLGAGSDLGGLGFDTSGFDAASWFSFADGGDVSQGARPAVQKATGRGVMGSRTNAIDAAEANAVVGMDPNAALKAVIAASMQQPVRAMNSPIMNPMGMFPQGEPNPVDFLLRYLMPGTQDNIYSYADGGSLTGPAGNIGLTQPVTRNRAMMGSAPKKSRMTVGGSPGVSSLMLNDMSKVMMNQQMQGMSPEAFQQMMEKRRREYDAAYSEAKRDALQQGVGNAVLNYFSAGLYGLANRVSGGALGDMVHSVAEPFADAGDVVTESIIEEAKDPLGAALDPSRPIDTIKSVFKAFGFADGGNLNQTAVGRITAPGTGTSDSAIAYSTVPGQKPIRVSNSEHIIPADTADWVGRDFLDRLIAMTHTPVRR